MDPMDECQGEYDGCAFAACFVNSCFRMEAYCDDNKGVCALRSAEKEIVQLTSIGGRPVVSWSYEKESSEAAGGEVVTFYDNESAQTAEEDSPSNQSKVWTEEAATTEVITIYYDESAPTIKEDEVLAGAVDASQSNFWTEEATPEVITNKDSTPTAEENVVPTDESEKDSLTSESNFWSEETLSKAEWA